MNERFVVLNLREPEELHDCRYGDRGWYGALLGLLRRRMITGGGMKGCGVPSTLINKRHVATLEKYIYNPQE